MDLSGRKILVTGASSGIGRATAICASRAGAEVLLVARNREQLLKTQSLCEGEGHQVVEFDLENLSEIPKWMKQIAFEHGEITGFVHSAGLHEPCPVQFLKPQQVEKIMNVNLQAALQLTKGFRQKSVCTSNGMGSVVFLSSVLALVGQPGTVAYSASKGAIIASTRSLALELASQNIRVNAIAPGTVKTEMTENFKTKLTEENFEKISKMHPLGLGEPEDIANAAIFLLSDAARWITGTTLVVDGGYTAH